jgi:hypothetical protein
METTETPTSKSTGKRLAAGLDGLDSINIVGWEISATKEPKITLILFIFYDPKID